MDLSIVHGVDARRCGWATVERLHAQREDPDLVPRRRPTADGDDREVLQYVRMEVPVNDVSDPDRSVFAHSYVGSGGRPGDYSVFRDAVIAGPTRIPASWLCNWMHGTCPVDMSRAVRFLLRDLHNAQATMFVRTTDQRERVVVGAVRAMAQFPNGAVAAVNAAHVESEDDWYQRLERDVVGCREYSLASLLSIQRLARADRPIPTHSVHVEAYWEAVHAARVARQASGGEEEPGPVEDEHGRVLVPVARVEKGLMYMRCVTCQERSASLFRCACESAAYCCTLCMAEDMAHRCEDVLDEMEEVGDAIADRGFVSTVTLTTTPHTVLPITTADVLADLTIGANIDLPVEMTCKCIRHPRLAFEVALARMNHAEGTRAWQRRRVLARDQWSSGRCSPTPANP